MWVLRYYQDRTKGLRGSRFLPFSSFKRTHLRHQTRYTVFLVKITILLCFKQGDQQALDLVQVKAHDIRAFTASKALYGGVLVDQIMQACHWKVHTHLQLFYLKDFPWPDNNNMYLGRLTAAYQVLDPSLSLVILGKIRGGGGTPA